LSVFVINFIDLCMQEDTVDMAMAVVLMDLAQVVVAMVTMADTVVADMEVVMVELIGMVLEDDMAAAAAAAVVVVVVVVTGVNAGIFLVQVCIFVAPHNAKTANS
jgi:hypothetical protein